LGVITSIKGGISSLEAKQEACKDAGVKWKHVNFDANLIKLEVLYPFLYCSYVC
jgi:hypothetical protein